MPSEETSTNSSQGLESGLAAFAAKVSEQSPPAKGSILVRTTDTHEEFSIEGLGPRSRVSRSAGRGQAVVEVRSPSSLLQAILNGEIEASRAFARGQIRVRGDLPYLEGVLKDVGLLNCG